MGKKKKSAQCAHVQQGKCMAWVGLGPRRCSWVSSHVYLQGPRSDADGEGSSDISASGRCGVPGEGTTLPRFTALDPPSPPRRTRGSYGTLFNQLLHHNQLRSHRRGFFRPELMLIAAAQMTAHHPNLTRFVR